jgi:hypothetical protein
VQLLQSVARSERGLQLLHNATLRALDWLAEHYGRDSVQGWRWGQVHSAVYPHPLSPVGNVQDDVLALGPVDGAGGLDTTFMQSYSYAQSAQHLLFRDDLHSKAHDLRTAFTMVADLSGGVEAITATGSFLASSGRITGAPQSVMLVSLEDTFWRGLQQVLDIAALLYHKWRAATSSTPPQQQQQTAEF